MDSQLDHPAGQGLSPVQTAARLRWTDCWPGSCSLVALLTPRVPSDPAGGLALQTDPPPGDAAMLSAYYLSFYE